MFNCNKTNPGSLCWFGHSVHSWGESWEEVPLLWSCCSLLFQKCLGGALNLWSLSPVQIHPFTKQESNWLSSVVVTRKNFCGFHSAVFVADSRQKMRLFQSYIFGFQANPRYFLPFLNEYLMSALFTKIVDGHSSTFFKVPAQCLVFSSSETGSVCGDKCPLPQGCGFKFGDNVQVVILPVLFSTLAKWGDGYTLTPTESYFYFSDLK